MTWRKKGSATRVATDDFDSMKLGGGGKFSKLENSLKEEPGVRDPEALAASIGRKKYGPAKFGALSKGGK